MPKVFHRQDLRLKKRRLRMSEFEWHMKNQHPSLSGGI